VFRQIRRLRDRGVAFCPASGRQYNSLRRLFAPVADELCYLCENGGALYGPGNPGPLLDRTPLPREEALALCADILAREGCEVLISGVNTSYLCPRRYDLSRHLRDEVGNRVTVLDAPEDTPEEIVKVSLYTAPPVEPFREEFRLRWGNRFRVAVSGANWLDFTIADKGSGLRRICGALGVPMESVMAIGDNDNDLSMLLCAGRPVIMENAAEPLRARFPEHCLRVEDTLALL